MVAALGCGTDDETIADRPKPKNYLTYGVGYLMGFEAHPINKNATPTEYYGLSVKMRWESSTTNLQDLRNCVVRERAEAIGKEVEGWAGDQAIIDLHKWTRARLLSALTNGDCVVIQTVEYRYKDRDEWNELATYRITRQVRGRENTWFFITHVERTDKEGEVYDFPQPINQVNWPADWKTIK
jgi:hypothetical protein